MDPRQWFEMVRRVVAEQRMRATIERRMEIYVGRHPTIGSRFRRLVLP